jgi:hypothetical protein
MVILATHSPKKEIQTMISCRSHCLNFLFEEWVASICMVTKNVCIPYMRKSQPYNISLANHTIHVFVMGLVGIRNHIYFGGKPLGFIILGVL